MATREHCISMADIVEDLRDSVEPQVNVMISYEKLDLNRDEGGGGGGGGE